MADVWPHTVRQDTNTLSRYRLGVEDNIREVKLKWFEDVKRRQTTPSNRVRSEDPHCGGEEGRGMPN